MNSEQLGGPVDFRDRLRETRRIALDTLRAQNDGEQPIGNPPRTSILEAYSDLPDDHIIYLPPLLPETATAVLTTDLSQYTALLKQAAEVSLENDVDGFPVGFEEAMDEWVRGGAT